MPANFVITQAKARHTGRIAQFLLCLAMIALADNAAAAELPPPHTAYYRLYKGIVILAKTRRSFSQDKSHDNQYIFKSYTEPAGVGKIITGTRIKEQSNWMFKDNAAIPLSYTYVHRGGDNDRDVKLLFDWEKNKVTNIINGDPWTMDLVPNIQDKLLYQFSLMMDLKKGVKEFSYEVADGGKLKSYHGTVIGETVIETDIGKFNTVIVRREHDGRRTTFWCAKQMHFIPVQIEQVKNGSTVTARLYEVKGVKVPAFEDPDW